MLYVINGVCFCEDWGRALWRGKEMRMQCGGGSGGGRTLTGLIVLTLPTRASVEGGGGDPVTPGGSHRVDVGV
jgi:hypothetical protein